MHALFTTEQIKTFFLKTNKQKKNNKKTKQKKTKTEDYFNRWHFALLICSQDKF